MTTRRTLEIAQLRDSEVELSATAKSSCATAQSSCATARSTTRVDDASSTTQSSTTTSSRTTPSTVPPPARAQAYDSEELPTQPHIDSNRFPLSLLNARRDRARPQLLFASEEDPHVADVLLGEVRGLEDVPPEGQAILAREARIERLGADEEIGSFGLALVVRGGVKVMPAIADLGLRARGQGRHRLERGQPGGRRRAAPRRRAKTPPKSRSGTPSCSRASCATTPGCVEDLKNLADRFQALAGVAMGPMGERLDDSLRAMVTERCEIKRLLAR